jgi:hypothetical protein
MLTQVVHKVTNEVRILKWRSLIFDLKKKYFIGFEVLATIEVYQCSGVFSFVVEE